MIREIGNMWRSKGHPNSMMLVTANSVLNRYGWLVMGAGAAYQARLNYPMLDKVFGDAVAKTCGSHGVFGLIIHPDWPEPKTNIGLFQTKTDWRQPSNLDIIQKSADMLALWAAEHPDIQVHLNYPGIGLGGLPIIVVQPIVDALPDNVHIWTLKGEPYVK